MSQNPVELRTATANHEWSLQFPRVVAYQIFTRSFADGNGDGKGDLIGIRKKLPYLKELGIGALWLTPIFKSPSYHKYDVTDYYAIDPEYGNMADLKALVNEAHASNIKIILDFVANHTSVKHPWFQEAAKFNNNPYQDFYIWSRDKEEWARDPEHWYYPDPKNPGDEKYYAFFSPGMPDLNYDNDTVRSRMIHAAEYWIQQTGIDGYRLDAASHVYPYAERTKNYAWWTRFSTAMRAVKPDFYIVGEMWGGDTLIAPYLKAGMNAGFNFGLWFDIRKSLEEGNDHMVNNLFSCYDHYQENNSTFTDAIFISNHDNPRIMDEVGGNMDKAKLAAHILFTLPYTPYVYYGDELGMFGPKPDEHIREPFLWGLKNPFNCKWEPNFHNARTKSLLQQQGDPNSLYSTYKKLIALRNKSEALSEGRMKRSPVNQPGLLSWMRSTGESNLIVIHNLQPVASRINLASLPGAGQWTIEYKSSSAISLHDQILEIPAYGTVLVK